MKKIISVITICVLLTGTFSVISQAEEKQADLCFALASDLHYNPVSAELEKTNDDEVFWYANRRAALEEESGFIIDEFLKQCAGDDSIEYVLISGDLADDGRTHTEDHIAMAEKLRSFENETGKSVFVINGNHDAANNCDTTYSTFKSIYHDFGYDLSLTETDYDCSYTADLGEKYRLIALDTNNPDESTEDGMSLRKMLWVKAQAEKAAEDGRYPVVMMHHNLLDHLPMQRIISRNFIVRFHYTTATMFADWGIRLVMTGHEHCSDAAVFTSASGNKIYDLATTSLTMYPLEYRVLSFTEDEITYSSRAVEEIDTGKLAQAQPLLSETQFGRMNEGMNDYALAFLKAGVEYRLALSLTPEKLGIKESDVYYSAVMTAVNGLTDILEMPLYGENSVEELAGEYGIEIPQSSYYNLWDLATSLVSMHYAGEEAFSTDSDEITILLRGVSLILKDDLSRFNDEVILSLVTKVLEKNGMNAATGELTRLCSSAFGGIRPDEYLTVALLSPFLYEFAFDSDGVNDNNGVMEGYGTDNNLLNIKNSIEARISGLFTYMKLYFGFVMRIFRFC